MNLTLFGAAVAVGSTFWTLALLDFFAVTSPAQPADAGIRLSIIASAALLGAAAAAFCATRARDRAEAQEDQA